MWLALAPPRWLRVGRHARRFGVAMAIVLVAGFVLAARQDQSGVNQDSVTSYLLSGPMLVLLTGSAVAVAGGRSFRVGLGACA